jgi:hypothetical protein
MVASAIEIFQQKLQKSRTRNDACSPCQEERDYVLMYAILHLQQPERHKGKTRKFVPDNQREFLKQFQVRYDSFSEEQAKHVNLRNGGTMKKALILLTLSFVSLGSLHAQQCRDSDKVQFNAPMAGFKNRLPYHT